MKKTTILALAGLFALTGCKQFVMDERVYADPEPGKTQLAGPAQDPAPLPVVVPEAPTPAPAPVAAPARVEFEPMPQLESYKQVGITSDRRVSRRSSGKTVRTSAPGGIYIVKPGDTLGRIAYAHHVSLKSLMAKNGLTMKDARRLRPGRKLQIPGRSTVKATVNKKRSQAKSATAVSGKLLNADGTYTVRRGDSIPKIARKLKIKARDLQSANNLTDEATRRLQIGQKLIVPGATSGVSAVPVPQTVDVSVKIPDNTSAPVAPVDAVSSDVVTPEAAPVNSEVPASAKDATPVQVVAPQSDVTVSSPDLQAAETSVTEIVNLAEDTTFEELSKKYNISVEELKLINPSMKDMPVLKAGDMVFVPAKKK